MGCCVVEDVLFTALKNAVGTAVENRIYPNFAPQELAPPAAPVMFVTYRLISGAHDEGHSGAQYLYRSRWQIDLIGPVMADCLSVKKSIIDYFSTFFSSSTDPKVLWSRSDTAVSMYEPNVKLYRYIIGVSLVTSGP